MNNKTDNKAKKKTSLIIVAVVAALIIVAILYYFSKDNSEPSAPIEAQPEAVATSAAEEAPISIYDGYGLKDDLKTVLIAGLDKYEAETDTESYNNFQQSDFLMLLVFDDSTEEACAIKINRDTMGEVMRLGVRGEKVGYKTMQLALSHTFGTGGNDSCRNTVDAVSRLLNGIEIDHYIFLTMDAIPILNDLCGGVTLELMGDFTEINPEMTDGAEYTLKGDEALKYVRSRMSVNDGTNIARMARQEQYMQTLYEKLISVPEDDDKEFILKLTSALSDYMKSDCTVNQLDALYDRGQAYANTGFLDIKGESVEGEPYMEFYVDRDALDLMVRDVFYEKLQ